MEIQTYTIYYVTSSVDKLYQHSQSIDKATEALQTAYLKSPLDIELLFELTNLLIKRQMYSDAIKNLKQAFKRNPENKSIELIIADCYYLQVIIEIEILSAIY
jgi:tetratricopeptide (TPR) repeat protein